MKPMLKYRGGKSKEIPHIMCHLPRFTGKYVEPFFGGGALFFYLEPSRAIINDINSRLINFYRGVRDNYPTLRKELTQIEETYEAYRKEFETLKKEKPSERVKDKNEDIYYRMRDMYNGLIPSCYSEALLYFYINKTAYSGMIRYNAQGEFNVPFGRYQHLNTQIVSPAHHLLLQRAEIYNKDYKEIFDLCNPDDFMFLDPPYDCVFSDYGNAEYREGFDESTHRRLAQDFKNLPCKTLLVIGKTPLTTELYAPYIIAEYDKSYAVNIRNRFKAAAKHIIVTNYRKTWDIPTSDNYHSSEILQPCLFEAPQPYGKEN